MKTAYRVFGKLYFSVMCRKYRNVSGSRHPQLMYSTFHVIQEGLFQNACEIKCFEKIKNQTARGFQNVSTYTSADNNFEVGLSD